MRKGNEARLMTNSQQPRKSTNHDDLQSLSRIPRQTLLSVKGLWRLGVPSTWYHRPPTNTFFRHPPPLSPAKPLHRCNRGNNKGKCNNDYHFTISSRCVWEGPELVPTFSLPTCEEISLVLDFWSWLFPKLSSLLLNFCCQFAVFEMWVFWQTRPYHELQGQ